MLLWMRRIILQSVKGESSACSSVQSYTQHRIRETIKPSTISSPLSPTFCHDIVFPHQHSSSVTSKNSKLTPASSFRTDEQHSCQGRQAQGLFLSFLPQAVPATCHTGSLVRPLSSHLPQAEDWSSPVIAICIHTNLLTLYYKRALYRGVCNSLQTGRLWGSC